MRRLLPMVLALVTTAGVLVGPERGNRLYRAGKYAEAVDAYRAALSEGEEGPVIRYNLGTALLALGRYAEAEEAFRAALDAVDPSVREWVYFNLGQRYLEDARGQADPRASSALYDAAVEAYRQALRLRPDDRDAKWNYELALRERDESPPSGSGGSGGDREPNEEPESSEREGGSGGSGDPDQPGDPDRSEDRAGPPMSREQAERILSAVEQDERELFRDKLRKGQEAVRARRDW